MYNRVILIGRLTEDPDLRYTSSGTPVTNWTLAVQRPWKNNQGEHDADFISCVAWKKLAEIVANNLVKGRLVAVEGRLQIRKSEKDGKKYVNPEVVASQVRFLDYGSNKGNGKTEEKKEGESKKEKKPTEPEKSVSTGDESDYDVPF